MSDADKARAFAAEVVLEYGMPADRDQLVARLAYAYAAGSRDGYMEAAETASEAWGELVGQLDEEQADK